MAENLKEEEEKKREHVAEGSHPGLSEPRVRLVPLLLTENKGSLLDSAGLSPSLR